MVASACLHHGEEPVISGQLGSGTIFFTHCVLRCVFCQNYEISQAEKGAEASTEQLVEMMLALQRDGAHNINLVSPTQYGWQLKTALVEAKRAGLFLPVVYNTGGYDSLDLLLELSGLIDIYLPDLKYFNDERAARYSGGENYLAVATAGIREMHRQVGDIKLDQQGLAQKGVLVRHLVLPNNLADTKPALHFLRELSPKIWLSLMAQYIPQYRASEYPEINRQLLPEEYNPLLDYASELGLENVFIQDLNSAGQFLPDFSQTQPFNPANNQIGT